jgi:metal transporter CNNM
MMRQWLLFFCLAWLSIAGASVNLPLNDEIDNAISLLTSLGVPPANICTVMPNEDLYYDLPTCPPTATATSSTSWVRSRRQRWLQEEEGAAAAFQGERDSLFYITHILCAFACVAVAALAAGLTMGLLSLDPLMLLIKMRAGATKKEQAQAAALLPIVKQHHLLLVTLLLLNSLSNEALPLFLEVLVSPVMAVILSVTLVLFFGEIIPSAVFTGPNKIEIASRLTPLVRLVMFLLWPIAFPIAKLLDHVLHDDDQDDGDIFNRGELSALVRIQYEERMAAKKRRKQEKATFRDPSMAGDDSHGEPAHVGGLDFTTNLAIKASKREAERRQSSNSSMLTLPEHSTQHVSTDDAPLTLPIRRAVSIHVDEVSMVEGALSMKTKMAMDVFTPVHCMFSISHDMILNEHNVVNIYSRGYSRVPVYQPNPLKPKSPTAICGLLMTKQLIVVNPSDDRPLSTLPLQTPQCVSPKINLVDLLNLFQTGKVGHLALVCARPQVAQDSLNSRQALPEAAGLMG